MITSEKKWANDHKCQFTKEEVQNPNTHRKQ